MKQITLIIIALIVASCTGGPGFRPVPITITGTQALTLGFVESAPPPSVKEGQTFPVYIDVRNNGGSDIETGYYRILGNDPSLLRISPLAGTYSLIGRSTSNPQGDRSVLQLTGKAGTLGDQQHRMSAPFVTQFCYAYSTIASAEVCIDTDYLGMRQERKVCTPTAVRMSGGQGGPVGVIEIQTLKALPPEATVSDKVIPRFIIKIRNLAKGEIIDADQVAEYCAGNTQQVRSNVLLPSVSLSDVPLTCAIGSEEGPELEGEVKGKEGTILELHCLLEQGIPTRAGTYLGALSVHIDYGYVEQMARTIEITR